jgi:hypothetical protein
MISNDNPGLMEKIRMSVQPLTETGEFYLESITINEWDYTVTTILVSPNLTIHFHTNALYSGIGCVLISPSKKQMFLSDHFFPEVDLQKMGLVGESLEIFPVPDPGTYDLSTKNQAQWDAIMRKTGFIKKLYYLCLGIRYKLPEISCYVNEHTLNLPNQ